MQENTSTKDSETTSESEQPTVCSIEEMEYMTYLKLQCMQP